MFYVAWPILLSNYKLTVNLHFLSNFDILQCAENNVMNNSTDIFEISSCIVNMKRIFTIPGNLKKKILCIKKFVLLNESINHNEIKLNCQFLKT